MDKSKTTKNDRTTYLITKDLVETLRNKYEIDLSEALSSRIRLLGNDFVSRFWRVSGLPESVDSCDIEANILSAKLIGLLRKNGNISYISLDRVYVPSAPAYLEVTRLTDPKTGTIKISERPGSKPLIDQVNGISSDKITLVDVGVFDGKTLLKVIDMVKQRGIIVTDIYLAVSNQKVNPELNNNKFLQVIQRFNFYEWIELRDLLGIDGRNVGVNSDGTRLYIPYWENLADWASIPKTAEKRVADLCKEYSKSLFGLLREDIDKETITRKIGRFNENLTQPKTKRTLNFDLVIFDMDGVLYDFKDPSSTNKSIFDTPFYREVQERGIQFIAKKLSISIEEASKVRESLFKRYNGDISIALESEYGISKSAYFETVWDIDVSKYVNEDPRLKELLLNIRSKKALLTSAPRIWAEKVLKRIGVFGSFDSLWFGDGEIKKPNKTAYLQVLNVFNVEPNNVLVIDDEVRCLEQAKQLGINTMLKGSVDGNYLDYKISNIYDLSLLLS